MKTGIDAISFDIAKLHLPINTLAKSRNIDPEKLEKGLGLLKMTLPDLHQDAVVLKSIILICKKSLVFMWGQRVVLIVQNLSLHFCYR
jgi:hypothetical protein